MNIDIMVRAYLECALWSSNDESDESGGVPFDQNHGLSSIDSESLATARKECEEFAQANAADLVEVVPTRAGHDFWLTRNGHGTGFWDRGLGEVGERLAEAARRSGERHPYLGDDGLIRIE